MCFRTQIRVFLLPFSQFTLDDFHGIYVFVIQEREQQYTPYIVVIWLFVKVIKLF